jgi:hypothetical protein
MRRSTSFHCCVTAERWRLRCRRRRGEVIMRLKRFLFPVFSFGGIVFLLSPATPTELPREGTCHLKIKVRAKQTLDQLSSARDGILSWDENDEATKVDCGQTQWPPMKEHCFGSGELDGQFAVSTGYCIDVDQDGDKIVWKLPPSKYPQYTATLNYSSDVLMASGKYKGMSGKSNWACVYTGSFTASLGECDVEMTFKLP